MPEPAGYIMRIKDEKWVEQVFDTAIYYSNLSRRWLPEQVVLFLHNTELGDAFVGYGVFSRTKQKRYLPDDERIVCEQGGWKRAIEFKYVVRFKSPLLIRDSVFCKSRLRGRYFHGLRLNEVQIKDILDKTEAKKTHQKS